MPTASVLAEIRRAGGPYGVISSDRFRLSQSQLERCCVAGALDRRRPGVYVINGIQHTPLQDLAVAIACAGRLAAAWGRSAAALWGLLPDHPPTPEIVIPRRRVAIVPGAVVHRSSDLCQAHLSYRSWLRTTNPLVTTLDLGVVLEPVAIADVIITARQLKLFEPRAIAGTLTKLARPGRNGIRNVRRALELVMIGDRPADTSLELRFHLGPGRYGLPPYEYQFGVRVRGRRLYIDFAYPSVKLAIEVDGYDKRRSRESLDYDGQRANLLVLNGWTILRFSWTRIKHDPAGVANEILAALGSLGFEFRR